MVKILLLPGIGDIHWVMLKLKSWLRGRQAEVWVWNFDGRPRSLDYLKMIPWIKVGGYYDKSIDPDRNLFNELYYKGTRDCVDGFRDFDYLIATNGSLRIGESIQSTLEPSDLDFNYGPVIGPEHIAKARVFADNEPYVLLFFSNLGMFGEYWRVHPELVKALLLTLRLNLPRHRLIFTGCEWDREYTSLLAMPGIENMIGKTDLGFLLALMKYASGFVGWCGGNGILAQHLGCPTALWWSKKKFPTHDRISWAHPEARYKVLEVEEFDVIRDAAAILDLVA